MANEGQNLPYSGPDYLPINSPVIYADGVWSLAHGNGQAKFYLFRLDPNIRSDNTSQPQVFAQIVMPVAGFVATAEFFKRQVTAMLKSNAVTQAQIDAIAAAFDTQEAAAAQNKP
jgi:hypothetical protein